MQKKSSFLLSFSFLSIWFRLTLVYIASSPIFLVLSFLFFSSLRSTSRKNPFAGKKTNAKFENLGKVSRKTGFRTVAIGDRAKPRVSLNENATKLGPSIEFVFELRPGELIHFSFARSYSKLRVIGKTSSFTRL